MFACITLITLIVDAPHGGCVLCVIEVSEPVLRVRGALPRPRPQEGTPTPQDIFGTRNRGRPQRPVWCA